VAFGGICDWLGHEPGAGLELEVEGPLAVQAGPLDDNLVLRAARALAVRIPGLKLGRFRLIKRLPAAAGLGGGSSDAAAALRALAVANGLPLDDERVQAAAVATGSDVPVCLSPRARMMRGIGDELGPQLSLPGLFALLVNPGVPAPTRRVFEALGLAPGSRLISDMPVPKSSCLDEPPGLTLGALVLGRNDLEAGALRVAPAIAKALETLSRLAGAKVVRISGSGATCFALFDNRRSASAGRARIAASAPDWWVKATVLR